jgi:hypothetical protein
MKENGLHRSDREETTQIIDGRAKQIEWKGNDNCK